MLCFLFIAMLQLSSSPAHSYPPPLPHPLCFLDNATSKTAQEKKETRKQVYAKSNNNRGEAPQKNPEKQYNTPPPRKTPNHITKMASLKHCILSRQSASEEAARSSSVRLPFLAEGTSKQNTCTQVFARRSKLQIGVVYEPKSRGTEYLRSDCSRSHTHTHTHTRTEKQKNEKSKEKKSKKKNAKGEGHRKEKGREHTNPTVVTQNQREHHTPSAHTFDRAPPSKKTIFVIRSVAYSMHLRA